MKPLRFYTNCYGNKFAPYLYVLLQSIDEIYGSDAQAIVYYDDLAIDAVSSIKRKMPHAKLYHYNLRQRGGFFYERKGEPHKAQFQIAKARHFITASVDDALDGPMVILDCDMLVTKRLDEYVSYVDNCDMVFTYKSEPDEQLQWPINSGIQIINNSLKIRKFYSLWHNETNWIIRHNGDPRNLWGGMQQAAFGRIIKTRDIEDYKNGFARNGCHLRGVPCKYLNETRRTQEFDDACIVHYKGHWRGVLPDKEMNHRVNRANAGKMYDLWQGHLERWNVR